MGEITRNCMKLSLLKPYYYQTYKKNPHKTVEKSPYAQAQMSVSRNKRKTIFKMRKKKKTKTNKLPILALTGKGQRKNVIRLSQKTQLLGFEALTSHGVRSQA